MQKLYTWVKLKLCLVDFLFMRFYIFVYYRSCNFFEKLVKSRIYDFQGANSHGQLALGNLVDVTSPHLASLSFKPELIVAGGRHTILTEEGKDWYYVCGCNDHQQLGVNSPDPEVQVPLAAKLCGTVKKAAAGWDFSLVVLGMRVGLTLVEL